jgi:glycosyltransferase involved in cell wall biosynthesis
MSKIDLVIPCYNEADRLRSGEIVNFLNGERDIYILFVNDGSNDATSEVIHKIISALPNQSGILHLSQNSGKAEAIRLGMLHQLERSEALWFGYWDADLSTPLNEVNHLLSDCMLETKLVMGSRVKRLGAEITRNPWRHLAGRVMATFVSWSLRLPVYDSQCGAKLIHRDVIQDVFSQQFLSRWLFDVEIIARLYCMHPEECANGCICEVPISMWRDIAGSKLHWYDMLYALLEILKINRRYYSSLSEAQKTVKRGSGGVTQRQQRVH